MRLFGISLLALLLVGVVFVFSLLDTRSLAHSLLNRVAEPTRLVFDAPQVESEPATEKYKERFFFNQDRAVILSGLPAYQSVRFMLPRDARPVSGRLKIQLTAQVLPGTEAVLRVQIGGSKRGELLLEPGKRRAAFEVELASSNLAGSELTISFSVLGKGPTAPCDGAGPLSTTLEIEPTSALELVLNAPLKTPWDLVTSWGGTAQIGWSEGLSAKERAIRLTLAADLLRRNGRAAFIQATKPSALNTRQLRELMVDWPYQSLPPAASSLLLSAAGPNAGIRRFTHQTRWRTGVGMRDLGPGMAPARLDLSLALGPLPSLSGWVLDVTLGGQLIHAEVVKPTSTTFKKSMELPVTALKPDAQIEITVTSSMATAGVCDEGPELIAEMRADSRLQLRADEESLPARLGAFLKRRKYVGIEVVGSLTPSEATAVAEALATITPSSTKLLSAGAGSDEITARVFSGASARSIDAELLSAWRVVVNGSNQLMILAPGKLPTTPPTALISFDAPDSGAT